MLKRDFVDYFVLISFVIMRTTSRFALSQQSSKSKS